MSEERAVVKSKDKIDLENELVLIAHNQATGGALKEDKKEGKTKKKKFEISICQCSPTDNCESNCVNRGLQIECTIGHCPTGKNCTNNRFQKKLYPKLEIFSAGGKGNGIRTLEKITPGQFLIEYVGEIILITEGAERMKDQRHFYFLTIDGKRGIDASRKGNIARYINHSCDPNCATRKWVVNGETRIGIFAIQKIKKNTEITFDYQFERIGAEKQKCLCGSEKCRGYLGAKAIEEARPEKHTMTSHKKHVQTILKNINWKNLDLAISETSNACIRNRGDMNETPVFLQRNYRKTHLHYLKTLQVAYVEQFKKVLEIEEERKKEVKKKQEMNAYLRTGSMDVEKLAKSGKLNFDDIILGSRRAKAAPQESISSINAKKRANKKNSKSAKGKNNNSNNNNNNENEDNESEEGEEENKKSKKKSKHNESDSEEENNEGDNDIEEIDDNENKKKRKSYEEITDDSDEENNIKKRKKEETSID